MPCWSTLSTSCCPSFSTCMLNSMALRCASSVWRLSNGEFCQFFYRFYASAGGNIVRGIYSPRSSNRIKLITVKCAHIGEAYSFKCELKFCWIRFFNRLLATTTTVSGGPGLNATFLHCSNSGMKLISQNCWWN